MIMYREKAMATKTVWPVTVNRITVPTVDKTSATHEWLIHNSCTPQRIVERNRSPMEGKKAFYCKGTGSGCRQGGTTSITLQYQRCVTLA